MGRASQHFTVEQLDNLPLMKKKSGKRNFEKNYVMDFKTQVLFVAVIQRKKRVKWSHGVGCSKVLKKPKIVDIYEVSVLLCLPPSLGSGTLLHNLYFLHYFSQSRALCVQKITRHVK